MHWILTLLILPLFVLSSRGFADAAEEAPVYRAEQVFPYNEQHNHAPGIVECPNGDLLVSWYRGSGERTADDVKVLGSRRKKGSTEWEEPFLMADLPLFPDCNTCMMIDRHDRLWLFWPIIIANTWESCLTNYRISKNYDGPRAPQWDWQGLVLLKPENFEQQFSMALDTQLSNNADALTDRYKEYAAKQRELGANKLFQRLGWQPRCKPTLLPSGRIVLPLYSDTFDISIMALSDDDGKTWYASTPLFGFGNIQPTVLRRDDGTLVTYMRDNGRPKKIRVSESKDDGKTWGPVTTTDFPNPGAGIDGVRLANGHWALVYNDSPRGRSSLAVSISDDEGKTWKWTRHLEHHESGSYHYPAVIQSRDGKTIYAIYSEFAGRNQKTMKLATFNEAWVRAQPADGK